MMNSGRALFDRVFPHPELSSFTVGDTWGSFEEDEDEMDACYEEYERMCEDYLIHTDADTIQSNPLVSDFVVIGTWSCDLWDYEKVRFVVGDVLYEMVRRFERYPTDSNGELLYDTFRVVVE